MTSAPRQILLKIRRRFSENEAVNLLLKRVSELETEVGFLKSELTEAQDTANKLRAERTLTKRQWMREEIFAEMSKNEEEYKKRLKFYKSQFEEWRNKYFSLLAKS